MDHTGLACFFLLCFTVQDVNKKQAEIQLRLPESAESPMSHKMASEATWIKDETFKLIDVWGQENVQVQLEDCKKTGSI